MIRVGSRGRFDGVDWRQDGNRERRRKVEETGWREKALGCLPGDRLVKSRRAHGCRPEGFTGICSFRCGSSVSAITGPPIPVWVPPASAATQLYSKKRFPKKANPGFTKPFLPPPPV